MNRIKELCVVRGIEQKELAISVGVSQPTVSDWFNQKKNPRGERLEKLSEILGVSKAEILGYSTPTPPPADDDPIAWAQYGPETREILRGILAKVETMDGEELKLVEIFVDAMVRKKKG